MNGIQLFDFFLCGLAIVLGLCGILLKLKTIEKRLITLTKAVGVENKTSDGKETTDNTRDTSKPRDVFKLASVRAGIPMHSDFQQNSDASKNEKG